MSCFSRIVSSDIKLVSEVMLADYVSAIIEVLEGKIYRTCQFLWVHIFQNT